jgi:peptide methionine sulfoxide reductase MsrB
MENKEIKALEVEINTSNKTIKIIKQSHRGHSFADGGNIDEDDRYRIACFLLSNFDISKY